MYDIREGSIVIIGDSSLKGIAKVESIDNDDVLLKDFILYFEKSTIVGYKLVTTPTWLKMYQIKSIKKSFVKRLINTKEFDIYMDVTATI